MNETLEIERYRELEAELRALTSKAYSSGALSGGLLVAAAALAWVLDPAASYKLSWTFLCVGVLCGLRWVIFVIEANRAKVELSVHLAKGQILAPRQITASDPA